MSGLLQPTLQDHVPRTYEGRSRPWRTGSQIYVAILGGPVAVTVIALLNARRLRMPRSKELVIAAVGIVATLAAIAVILAAPGEGRVLAGLMGAVAAGPFYLLMRSYDRAYFSFTNDDLSEDEAYESLWGPGIAAVIGGLILTAAVVGAA